MNGFPHVCNVCPLSASRNVSRDTGYSGSLSSQRSSSTGPHHSSGNHSSGDHSSGYSSGVHSSSCTSVLGSGANAGHGSGSTSRAGSYLLTSVPRLTPTIPASVSTRSVPTTRPAASVSVVQGVRPNDQQPANSGKSRPGLMQAGSSRPNGIRLILAFMTNF